MPLNDTGDIIRAVGFVAIYGAYVEDRIAELIDMAIGAIALRENIRLVSAKDQARHLLAGLKTAYSNASDFHTKQQDLKRITDVLSEVEEYLKERHIVIHSTLTAQNGSDKIIRKNRRNKTEEEVSSKEVIDLANNLYSLQTGIDGLKFPVERLLKNLKNN